ncbi:MAG: penicillin-binding protein 2 [Bacteriovoracaceae bacterium]
MFGEQDVVKAHKPRVEIISGLILVAFALIMARLWYLQIYKGAEFFKYSLENKLRREVVKAPRGLVFSRNNEILVHNSPRFDAIIIPQYLRHKEQTVKKLSKIVAVDNKKIHRLLKNAVGYARYQPVVIKKNISMKEVAIIETEGTKLPGVFVRNFISREYKDKEINSHLLGYISEVNKRQLPKVSKDYKLGDFIGHSGVEEKFDKTLRGKDGYQFIEVDARGRVRKTILENNIYKGIKNKKITAGNNIRLTIDRDLQVEAYKALDGKVGSAVAIDVHSGEVLAMVSRPGYDPTQFSRGLTSQYWSSLVNDEHNPLRDRAIQEHYSPGSTYKTITAIAGLEEKLINEKDEVHCPGYFVLGRRRFHCWKKNGHGKVNVVKAIRESCDVFFYKLATKLDIDVLAKYSKALGLGTKSGISLPREIPGLIPTKDWKLKSSGEEWQLGETLSCVIGQSFVLTTPLQLAMSYMTLANGGVLYKPRIVKEVFDNDGNITYSGQKTVISKNTISPKTMNLIKKGLYQVVNHPKGTAWWYRGRGIKMAGKTGTSQVVRFSSDKIYHKCEDLEYKYRHHGLFTAYAPEHNPRIAISVVVEHGCHGSSAAAPVARAIATKYMEKYFPSERKEIMKEERMAEQKRKKKLEEQKAKINNEES